MTLKTKSFAALAALFTLGAPVLAADVTAPITGVTGSQIGTVTVKGGATGVVARVELMPGSLTPGWHGMHLHAVGDCGDVGAFKNAKAHVAHEGAMHGLLNPEGPEEGDLPNLWVAEDGSAHAEIASSLVTLGDGANGLLDADGSALVIHETEDDHLSQPIGNSGARLACAVLK